MFECEQEKLCVATDNNNNNWFIFRLVVVHVSFSSHLLSLIKTYCRIHRIHPENKRV